MTPSERGVLFESCLERLVFCAVARRLRIAREEAGLGREQLAAKAGLYREFLERIEMTGAPCDASVLRRLGPAVGRDPDWFLNVGLLAGDDKREQSRDRELAKIGVREIYAASRNLPSPDLRLLIYALMTTLAFVPENDLGSVERSCAAYLRLIEVPARCDL